MRYFYTIRIVWSKVNKVLEAQISKNVLRLYLDNIDKFNNRIRADTKKKIKSEEFNICVAYLLITNSFW